MKFQSTEKEVYAKEGILTGCFSEKDNYHCIRNLGSEDHLLIYTKSGSGEIISKNISYKTQRGDFTLWKPNTYQEYKTCNNRWDLFWVHFNPKTDWYPLLNWREIDKGISLIHIDDLRLRKKLEDSFFRMNQNYKLPYNQAPSLAQNKLEELLIWISTAIEPDSEYAKDPRITHAKEYICANFYKDINLEDIAETVGLSISRLAHLFKKITHMTPINYLEEQRISYATHLLKYSSYSVNRISEECGFKNAFYFSNRFRKAKALSPKEFRKINSNLS